MEKGLYSAPQGVSEAPTGPENEPIEVVIADEGQNEEAPVVEKDVEDDFGKNLALEMDDRELDLLAIELLHQIDEDVQSRKDWEQTYYKGLDLLGLKVEERTEPWNGACGVYHPMLSEAVVRFQSETIMETFPPAGPVKTKIIGKITEEKEKAAARVKEDMNYELTEVMTDYRPEHERLLWSLPLSGSAFKKVYFDPSVGRPVAMFVPAEDMIVPYGASTLESSPRVTQKMRKTENELARLMYSKFYRDIDLGTPTKEQTNIDKSKDKLTGASALNDDRFIVYESHTDLNLREYKYAKDDPKDTGLAFPYVVTINYSNRKILAIYRNWEQEDDKKLKRNHFVHYGYVPGFGFYNFGLIHLIGGFAKGATSIIRQLVDAGTLANLPGGLKAKGLRIKGDDTPIRPGEFRDVDIMGGTIKDNIVNLPYKEPSATLLQLYIGMVDEGRRMASAGDLKIGDMNKEAPVGTTLAILERVLKIMSAIQARVHATMKQEFKLLKAIIKENTPEEYDYDPDDDEDEAEMGRSAKQSDYDLVEVIPVSDPNASTMAQRIVTWQAAFQLAGQAPQIYDLAELHKQMLEILGVKNIGKILPATDDFKPKDPVSENMAILTGRPVKAFLNQDHASHIQAHMSLVQDPLIQQLVGQSPSASILQAAMSAHVAEHVAYKYRSDIEEVMGVKLPEPDGVFAPDIEAAMSKTIAEASGRVLQRDQALAAQQAAQQAAQDPMLQLQKMEIGIKDKEVERKKAKDQQDAQFKSEELKAKGIQLGHDLIKNHAQTASQEKQKGLQIGADLVKHHTQIGAQKEQQHKQLGIDVLKHGAQLDHQAEQQQLQHEHDKTIAAMKPKPKSGGEK
jgi:chaperonin GroES